MDKTIKSIFSSFKTLCTTFGYLQHQNESERRFAFRLSFLFNYSARGAGSVFNNCINLHKLTAIYWNSQISFLLSLIWQYAHKGISQLKLSEAANVSNKYLSAVEVGRSKVSLEVLQKICRALNTPLDYIVNNTPCDRDVKIIDDIYEKITQLSRSDREVVTALLDALNNIRGNK